MDVTKTQCQQDSRTDVITIAAISVVTLFLESVSHHGLGHGGAFLVMGARLKRLSSLLVSADATGLAPWQGRVVFAAGSGADVIMALTCLGLLHSGLTLGQHARYFLWLTMVTGFFLPAAYLLLTWFPVGDWYTVTSGLWQEPAWRFLLTIAGAGMYALGMRLAVREIEPFLSSNLQERRSDARLLSLVPYLTIGTVNTLAPLVGRAETIFIVFGLFFFIGLAGFCFIHQSVGEQPSSNNTPEALPLRRNIIWIVVGAVALVVFLGVLGPGIDFSH